jgi:hypothetical protein
MNKREINKADILIQLLGRNSHQTFEFNEEGGFYNSLMNCVWLTIITMTTVGFGD